MTHSSLAHERGADEPQREDNETLEFLGDAVVGMVAAESVFRRYPELSEGALTRLRGALVSRRHLAEVAAGLKLGKYLLLGRGEERSGGRIKTALLANAMEAVIGAVYLDAGLEAARGLIEDSGDCAVGGFSARAADSGRRHGGFQVGAAGAVAGAQTGAAGISHDRRDRAGSLQTVFCSGADWR